MLKLSSRGTEPNSYDIMLHEHDLTVGRVVKGYARQTEDAGLLEFAQDCYRVNFGYQHRYFEFFKNAREWVKENEETILAEYENFTLRVNDLEHINVIFDRGTVGRVKDTYSVRSFDRLGK